MRVSVRLAVVRAVWPAGRLIWHRHRSYTSSVWEMAGAAGSLDGAPCSTCREVLRLVASYRSTTRSMRGRALSARGSARVWASRMVTLRPTHRLT